MTKETGNTSKLLGFNVLGGSRGVLVCRNGACVEGVGCCRELGSAVRSVEQLVLACSLVPGGQAEARVWVSRGVARGRGGSWASRAGRWVLAAGFPDSSAHGSGAPLGQVCAHPPAPSNILVRTRRAVVPEEPS